MRGSEGEACMGWETDKATNLEWYKQETDWGCPYSCVAMVLNWIKAQKCDEKDVRERAATGSLMWPEDPTKRSEGAALGLVRSLLMAYGIDAAAEREPNWYSLANFEKLQSEASPDSPAVLGLRWSSNDLHLVVCVGKQSNSTSVRIVDPGFGVVLNPLGFGYQAGANKGTFNQEVIEVLGTY